MTPDPSATTPAAELTKPLRPIAAFALLGANALFLLLAVQSYLIPPASGLGFGDRSGGAFYAFTDFVTSIGFPLLAVLLVTHIAPVVAQARLIVLVALGEYAFAALFAVISFLGALFSAATFRGGVEGFFARVAHLAVFAVAALIVLRIAQQMRAEPKEDRLSQYGRGGFDPYAAREPQHTPYGAEQPQQPYGEAAYSGGGAYGGQPGYEQYGEVPPATKYGGGEPTTYGSSEPTTYGSSEPTTYGSSEPTTYGSSEPTTYGSSEPRTYGGSEPTSYGEQGYGQQYPPQQQGYAADPNAQYQQGGYAAPTAQVYGGAAAQQPPAWDQPPYQPPQPPGGWPAQTSSQPQPQPPAGNVYGGEPSWPQEQPYQDEEARRAEEARLAAQHPQNPADRTWFDQR